MTAPAGGGPSTRTPHPYFEVFRSRRAAVVLLLGFASGLPLALTGSTLQAWLTLSGVDIRTIAWFSWIGVPYVAKFLWSPLVDRYTPAWLGRRRGWLGATQLGLTAGLCGMALTSPGESLFLLGAFALWVAFVSASQDIVVDAYRTDVLAANERGMGAAVGVLGYRLAMLVSGGLALVLADHIGWRTTYLAMAALMSLSLLTTLWSEEPPAPTRTPTSLAEAVIAPLVEYFSRPCAWPILLLIVFYKFGDALAGTLTTAFFIRGLGFSAADVGYINKGMGLAALLVGAIAGGALLARLSLVSALIWFGWMQAISNLSFVFLAWAGKSYGWLVFTVAFENLASGMGTAAFVALAMSLCNRSFSATQYALISALASLGRVLFGPLTGYAVEAWGWAWFYFATFAAALPGIGLVFWLRKELAAPPTVNAPLQLAAPRSMR